jgi:hypothetical protein
MPIVDDIIMGASYYIRRVKTGGEWDYSSKCGTRSAESATTGNDVLDYYTTRGCNKRGNPHLHVLSWGEWKH